MIDILENNIWKDTGWSSFEQMKEYVGRIQKTWSDNGYNYIMVKYNIDDTLEIYRQKIYKDEHKHKACTPEKTIFIFGQTQRQAEEYIKTNVKIITEGGRLRGYSKGNAVLIILPQEKEHVLAQAAARDFEVIEA